MGCYVDTANRDLEYFLYDARYATDSGKLAYAGFSVDRCIGGCVALGYKFAGNS